MHLLDARDLPADREAKWALVVKLDVLHIRKKLVDVGLDNDVPGPLEWSAQHEPA